MLRNQIPYQSGIFFGIRKMYHFNSSYLFGTGLTRHSGPFLICSKNGWNWDPQLEIKKRLTCTWAMPCWGSNMIHVKFWHLNWIIEIWVFTDSFFSLHDRNPLYKLLVCHTDCAQNILCWAFVIRFQFIALVNSGDNLYDVYLLTLTRTKKCCNLPL